jgi:hypothetical protein
MTAIPEDILTAAQKAYLTYPKEGEEEWLPMARALAVERRRCALIARQWHESSFKDEVFAANSIADQIMAGAK